MFPYPTPHGVEQSTGYSISTLDVMSVEPKMAVFRNSGELPKTVILAFTVVVVVLIVTWNLTPPATSQNKTSQPKTWQKKSDRHYFLVDRKAFRTGVTVVHITLIGMVKRSTFWVSEWGWDTRRLLTGALKIYHKVHFLPVKTHFYLYFGVYLRAVFIQFFK